MIHYVRTEAGLGNPPTKFSTKAANIIVEYGLHFDPQKPHVFMYLLSQAVFG